MPDTPSSAPPLNAVLKSRAMALDAEMLRRLRRARRLSDRLLHDVRVACKRQRAWWQLAAPLAGRAAARNAGRRLGTAARATAPLRESHVMRRVLLRLARQAGDPRMKSSFEAAARQLLTLTPAVTETEPLAALRTDLLQAFASDAAAWRRLRPAPDAEPLMREAVVSSYRRARKRSERAARRGRARDLHAWRKWVKIHLAQLEFIRSERPRQVKVDLRPLVRLGRLLGRRQDLAVLEAWFAWRKSTGATGADEARRLRTFLGGRQKDLRARCTRLGRGVFAPKPRELAARLQPPPPRAPAPRRAR